jgi:hypothetical protein
VRSSRALDRRMPATAGSWCYQSHVNNRYHINRCDVTEIDSGANWGATWAGPNMQYLGYYSMSPYRSFTLASTFCVGDIHIRQASAR